MKILILYSLDDTTQRKTIKDHLYSFRDYGTNASFHYCNIFVSVPFYLKWIEYDAIILHYTLLSLRWESRLWPLLSKALATFKETRAIKIAMPQDEYAETAHLCTLFKECGIDTVYTCAYPIDYQTLYPQKETGLKNYFTTTTGFVDENTLHLLNKKSAQENPRTIDIGYRARAVPFWLGEFGTTKAEIARVFNQWKPKTSLHLDISTDPKEVFLGDEWIEFLLRCRTMLGCLGGASLIDSDGTIRKKTDAYVAEHPDASFAQVKEQCFADKDNTLHLFALSPRHFECAMAKTCQILLEGDYQGVLQPGVDYIELKADFSNVADVLQQVEDHAFCEKIAANAYKKVVESGNYTYSKFANTVIDQIKKEKDARPFPTNGYWNSLFFNIGTRLLSLRQRNFPVHFFLFRLTRFRMIRIPKFIKALGFAS